MKVLVIRKPTNLEQHGEFVSQQFGQASDHFEVLRKAHEDHYRCLDEVRRCLTQESIEFVEVGRSERRPRQVFHAVITVGGDGTLLTSSHEFVDAPIPMIGIRSSDASVGYLCAGDVRHVPTLIKQLGQGKISYYCRHRLKAKVKRSEDGSEQITFPVLNDFLFANSNPASTTRYHLRFRDLSESHKSSGIWVATATGSTAATSAAGGQSLNPDDARFQFVVRELYQAHERCLVQKAFFEPGKDLFEIENHCAKAILALDGERGMIRLRFGDVISFLQADPIQVARPIDQIK